MSTKRGVLYGIGVGPGDPDLITVKALDILKRVPHIFAAASSKNEYSLAQNVVLKHLPDAQVEQLSFPMTKDKDTLVSAWKANANRTLEFLNSGTDAAFVTLGDPMTYSTFSYLHRTIKQMVPDLRVIIVPGVTSYHAAASLACTPLAEGEESFHLVSGVRNPSRLREILETSENVVVLKTYRSFDDIRRTLEESNLVDRAVCVMRCGLEGETVLQDLRSLTSEQMPYLSLIIVKRKGIGP
ncbi:MAG: precorrin-2 C(20)-methyltransferase [Deltaproteobacteria bacterium]|nr:precorrin-2 C(20)-methyltransferase [Deltaproteobacteria bacterium]